MLGKTCSEKRRKGKITSGRLNSYMTLALKPLHQGGGGGGGRKNTYLIKGLIILPISLTWTKLSLLGVVP